VTTHVERSIEVEVPVRTAYDQWTQFEEFPRFMGAVEQVRQIGDAMTHWVAEIAGVRREWDAAIVEQVPDRKVAWAATTGATNAGAVYFTAAGAGRTQVRLTLDFEPEGLAERAADVLDVVSRQAVADLNRFKEYIERRGEATGGWRGTIGQGDAAAAGVVGGAGAAASSGVDTATGAGTASAGISGDPLAVGPTGDTRGTTSTESGPARGGTGGPDLSAGVGGHSGDPVAVEQGVGEHSSRGQDRTGYGSPTANAASGADTGVVGFGTNTGLSSADPESGAFTGNPEPGAPGSGRAERGSDARTLASSAGAGAASPTANAASEADTGVVGFGTDTGLSSADPTSGAFTANPEPGAPGTGRAERDVDLGTSRTGSSADDPGRAGGGTRRGNEDWAPANVAPDLTGGAGTGRDVVTGTGGARPWAADDRGADLDRPGDPTAGTDRTGTPDPVRFTESADPLDLLDAPGPTDGVGAALEPQDTRTGTLDDPERPDARGV
jgi:hypothetical protein